MSKLSDKTEKDKTLPSDLAKLKQIAEADLSSTENLDVKSLFKFKS